MSSSSNVPTGPVFRDEDGVEPVFPIPEQNRFDARLSVLVVEDDAVLATDLEETLCAQGHEVLGPAPDIARAMTLLTAHRPDVVLCDLALRDGATGNGVVAACRAMGTSVIVLTGRPDDLADDLAGTVQVLPKPVSPDVLARAIASLSVAARRAAPAIRTPSAAPALPAMSMASGLAAH